MSEYIMQGITGTEDKETLKKKKNVSGIIKMSEKMKNCSERKGY